MRLLRGESLDLLARESGQPAGRISGWREEFVIAGREGLKARPAPVEEVALREALLDQAQQSWRAFNGTKLVKEVRDGVEFTDGALAPAAARCARRRRLRRVPRPHRRRLGLGDERRIVLHTARTGDIAALGAWKWNVRGLKNTLCERRRLRERRTIPPERLEALVREHRARQIRERRKREMRGSVLTGTETL